MKDSLLKSFFAAHAEHHVTAAKQHGKMAKEYAADSAHRKFHEAMRDSHATAAENCVECCKSEDDKLAAAAGGRFGMLAARDADQLEPTRVHGVLADNPNRLVARAGQPLILPDDPGEDVTSQLDKSMGRV